MKESINRCHICNKIVSMEKDGIKEKIDDVHGVCWSDIGYSIGGWGRRRNFMHEFSGEICGDCFTALEIKINEFKEVVQQRRNSCDEGICIYKTSKYQQNRDNMSEMQHDELQRKRRKSPLLRLLSSFSL